MPPPRISIIIPVYREARIICGTLAHLDRLSSDLSNEGAPEIIVVDGDRRRETLNEIRRISRIPVIPEVSEKGRGIQMNAGARQATGEILLFLHADTRLPLQGLHRIRFAMSDPEVMGGAFDLGIDSKRRIFRILERVASIRSRLTRIPYGDQAIFIRSSFFREIGGFQDIPIMEDVDLMRRIKRAGGSIVFLPEKVRTSPRRWEREGIMRGTLRNWSLLVLYLFGASPVNLARYYR